MIELRGVSKRYGELTVLNNIDLHIYEGEFVSIIGRSGSGKSTLMNILGCLDVPSEGEYLLRGIDATHIGKRRRAMLRNREIGFIFQNFNLIPTLSAIENVELPMVFRSISRNIRRETAIAALERVGLSDRMNHIPSKLSGGQQQRVAIARAIASDPPLILADEPTGNLDRSSAENCMELLSSLNREGHTLVLITHDSAVSQCAKRIITIEDGIIC